MTNYKTAPNASTPWGMSQHAEEYAPGIICYSTASHGGFHVTGAALAAIPRAWREYAAQWSHGYGQSWFEEDCAWAGVAIAHPHLFEPEHVAAAVRTAEAYKLPTSAPQQAAFAL